MVGDGADEAVLPGPQVDRGRVGLPREERLGGLAELSLLLAALGAPEGDDLEVVGQPAAIVGDDRHAPGVHLDVLGADPELVQRDDHAPVRLAGVDGVRAAAHRHEGGRHGGERDGAAARHGLSYDGARHAPTPRHRRPRRRRRRRGRVWLAGDLLGGLQAVARRRARRGPLPRALLGLPHARGGRRGGHDAERAPARARRRPELQRAQGAPRRRALRDPQRRLLGGDHAREHRGTAHIVAIDWETAPPIIPHPGELIFGIVAFAILYWVVAKKVVPRLEAMYSERAAAIEGQIEEADKANAEAAELLEQYKAQLAESRAEASKIREEARAEGAQILAELKAQAQSESERITASAQAQIAAERQQAVISLRAEVGALATELASRVVGESLEDEARQRRTVERFLAELEAGDIEPVSAVSRADGIGNVRNGSRSWIGVGAFSVQPSEFMKLAMIAFLAKYLSVRQKYITSFKKGLAPSLGLVFLAFGMIMLQPDLGTGTVMVGTCIVMIFIAGARISHFVFLGLLGLRDLLRLILSAPYRIKRIHLFSIPGRTLLAADFKLFNPYMRSVRAVCSG